METVGDLNHYMPDGEQLQAVREAVNAYNSERPSILRKSRMRVVYYMGIYVIFSALLLAVSFEAVELRKIIVVIGLALVIGSWYLWQFARTPIDEHQIALRDRLFPIIFDFIDDLSFAYGREPWFLKGLHETGLIHYTRSVNDYVLSGEDDGMHFEMAEIRLFLETAKKKTTMFRGIIFYFGLESSFPGLILAAKRGRWLQMVVGNVLSESHEPLSDGDTRLGKGYEFHSDNDEAAIPFVQSGLAAALKWLSNEWREGKVRLGLKDDACYLLLPTNRDWFALPDIQYDINYETDIEPMILDMAALFAAAHLIRRLE